ncbi:unnamed protein product [Acanthoscelides obtectus]|uniref:Uncharacterized protein n=1 Tax=Acanthoscelides obtectus TaxID=200917 RepID=A0A9P0JX28_ACAOB|nr:unnamed protein product [Acanthoscelides obtectus]CAK1639127.1 hypothetical protein AOBTE_LOCUS11008 [Acanthoscelides obtectus]
MAKTPSGTNTNNETEEKDENLKELISSCISLSKYESRSFKSLWPQIVAALIAAAFHIGNGTSMAYSAVLIAQLKEPGSEIKTTDQQNSWIGKRKYLYAILELNMECRIAHRANVFLGS